MVTKRNAVRNRGRYCTRCGKPLQNLPCYVCKGKGYIRESVFMKRQCTACNGRGTRLRCPDELSHKLRDHRLHRQAIYRNTLKNRTSGTIGQGVYKPKHKPQYPPRWHPMHPQYRMNPTNPMSPRHPMNPMNPMSPRHPLNPMNPMSPRHPMNPMNPMSPRHPLNPMNPMGPKPFK